MSACNCSGCPHAANCRCVCAACNGPIVPPSFWQQPKPGDDFGIPFWFTKKPTSDPLNVSVAEKGPAEQFDEPQIVHDSK